MAYANAPIVEAIFDIQVAPKSEISAEAFAKVAKAIKEDFPRVGNVFLKGGELTIDPSSEIDPVFQSTTISSGKIFSNDERTRHIQMRANGYTFNMQTPYTKWE